MKSKRHSPSGGLLLLMALLLNWAVLWLPSPTAARLYIDINAPATRAFVIALPAFSDTAGTDTEDLGSKLPAVIANDLELSGFFKAVTDPKAFLADTSRFLTLDNINFGDWTVLGAELLLTAGYTRVGGSIEVDIRLFDVFAGRQIMGKRVLGQVTQYRRLMHRVSNDIMELLTGYEGFFLTKIAFVGTATGAKEIYLADVDGYNARQLTRDDSIALSPRWSPAGDKLLYNSYREGSPMLYLDDFGGNSVRRISGRAGLNIGACWTPDGGTVALTLSHTGDPEIFTLDLSGRVLKRMTSHWGIDVSPAFSPNGRQMAFVSNRSGSPQVYVLDLDSGQETRLTFEGKYNTSPTWSPLGRIAYTSLNDGHFNICTIDPDGSAPRCLTESQGNNEDPCWSPDGRYLAFTSNRTGRYHVYLMNAYGQNQRQITSFAGNQTSPSWGR